MADNNTIVVGGGVAAVSAIETLRAEGYDGRIMLVSDECANELDVASCKVATHKVVAGGFH